MTSYAVRSLRGFGELLFCECEQRLTCKEASAPGHLFPGDRERTILDRAPLEPQYVWGCPVIGTLGSFMHLPPDSEETSKTLL